MNALGAAAYVVNAGVDMLWSRTSDRAGDCIVAGGFGIGATLYLIDSFAETTQG